YTAPVNVLSEIRDNNNVCPNYIRSFTDFKTVYSSDIELVTPVGVDYAITKGAAKSFDSNQIVLSNIPEKIYLVINKIKRSNVSATAAEPALCPSVSCRVSNLNVTINGSVINVVNASDISAMSARNGCTIDYLKQLYTHGQVVCFNLSNDVSVGS